MKRLLCLALALALMVTGPGALAVTRYTLSETNFSLELDDKWLVLMPELGATPEFASALGIEVEELEVLLREDKKNGVMLDAIDQENWMTLSVTIPSGDVTFDFDSYSDEELLADIQGSGVDGAKYRVETIHDIRYMVTEAKNDQYGEMLATGVIQYGTVANGKLVMVKISCAGGQITEEARARVAAIMESVRLPDAGRSKPAEPEQKAEPTRPTRAEIPFWAQALMKGAAAAIATLCISLPALNKGKKKRGKVEPDGSGPLGSGPAQELGNDPAEEDK